MCLLISHRILKLYDACWNFSCIEYGKLKQCITCRIFGSDNFTWIGVLEPWGFCCLYLGNWGRRIEMWKWRRWKSMQLESGWEHTAREWERRRTDCRVDEKEVAQERCFRSLPQSHSSGYDFPLSEMLQTPDFWHCTFFISMTLHLIVYQVLAREEIHCRGWPSGNHAQGPVGDIGFPLKLRQCCSHPSVPLVWRKCNSFVWL